jgi:hypothetical protein
MRLPLPSKEVSNHESPSSRCFDKPSLRRPFRAWPSEALGQAMLNAMGEEEPWPGSWHRQLQNRLFHENASQRRVGASAAFGGRPRLSEYDAERPKMKCWPNVQSSAQASRICSRWAGIADFFATGVRHRSLRSSPSLHKPLHGTPNRDFKPCLPPSCAIIAGTQSRLCWYIFGPPSTSDGCDLRIAKW